ncbi:hypothetical protein [Streptomyces sp. NPDC001530]|uniref:hypothetical protein n=1 Tax=Streptomyces sp. NPDC001530 TaxID=3364582 RepID=UPI003673C411
MIDLIKMLPNRKTSARQASAEWPSTTATALRRPGSGTPRNSDRMNDAFTALKLAAGTDIVAVALAAGIITAEQGEQIKTVWATHLQT